MQGSCQVLQAIIKSAESGLIFPITSFIRPLLIPTKNVKQIIRTIGVRILLAAELVYHVFCCIQHFHAHWSFSFDTIAASGEHSAMPHAIPTDKKLENGDFLTMDFGCLYQGYCSDMTRTVVIGSASEKQREIYDTVLKAQETALLGIRPGMKGSQIDAMARDVITDAGYGKYFGHALGHSVGLEIHESPNFSPREETVIKPGMVVTVEPGIYIEGIGGVRIEDVVIITEDGCENITHSTKKLLELTAQKG